MIFIHPNPKRSYNIKITLRMKVVVGQGVEQCAMVYYVVPRYHGVGNCDGVRWYATVPWYNVLWCARSLGAPHRKSIYRPLALLLSDLV